MPTAVKSNFARLKMPTSSHLAALATLALVLAVASAQGPECKTGPHPTVLAVQQKCAKGSLLCKEVQVTNCALTLSTPSPPTSNLKPQTSNLRNPFTMPNVSRALRSTSFPSTWTLPKPSKKFSTHQVRQALPPAAPSCASPPSHWHSATALALARDSESVCGAVIPNLNHKETEYATVLSASDGTKYAPTRAISAPIPRPRADAHAALTSSSPSPPPLPTPSPYVHASRIEKT
jgi:hypothetical protein